MPTTLDAPCMAEKRPASATAKIDAELLRKAKQVCALREIKLQDYLDSILRGPIEKDHAKAIRILLEEHKADG